MADALTGPSFALLAVAFGAFARLPALAIASPPWLLALGHVLAGCELAAGAYVAAAAGLDICLESFPLPR